MDPNLRTRISLILPFCLSAILAVELPAQDPSNSAESESPAPEQNSQQGEGAKEGGAGESADPQAEWEKAWAEAVGQLKSATGKVKTAGDRVEIDLPQGWAYFGSEDAQFIVGKLWDNPPDPGLIGLVAPPGFATNAYSWAMLVYYKDEGHTEDSGAESIDYDDLLADMKKDTKAANPERIKRGYPSIKLLGWAEPPHYDADAKKLYWARSLEFGTGEERNEGLNYDIRVLGRRGTLVMSAVAHPSQLADVRAGSKQVLAKTSFVDGERYSDFQSGVDPVVAGGIGALIAGKVLLKGGVLKLLAGLWKPIAVGLVAIVGVVAKLFGLGRSKAEPNEADAA